MLRYIAVFLALPIIVFAQGTVTIYGTVTDPSGAAIVGAKITVTNDATQQSRDTVAAADGNYVVPDLPISTYKLTVSATGFKTFVQDGILVQVDENRRVPVQMAVGGMSESVTVAADVAQVETRNSALRQVVDSERIIELPLNGRNPLQLSYLVAGSSGSTDPSGGQALNTSVAIDGLRGNFNNYSLDGADNHDPFFNTPSSFPNPDALEEFSLQTSNYSAELGRNAGGAMNAVTRSGTNDLHGTLFEFLRNYDMDSRNFFANSVSPYKRNQFGGTVGGPIRRDKTFFFAAYQGTRIVSDSGTQTPVVLSAAQRTGDFTGAKTIKDPNNGQPFPNNIIPMSRISPFAINFMSDFVPLPNAPNNVYTFPAASNTVDDQAVAKIDHQLTMNNHLSGRLLYERNNTNQVPDATDLPGFWAIINYSMWNVAINDIHIFSLHLVNQFTFGFNDIVRNQLPHVESQVSLGDLGSGFVRAAPGPIAWDTTVSGYFDAFSRYVLNQYRKGFQYTDALNWSVGSHNLKLGVDVRQDICLQNQIYESDALVQFTANYTGLALADFLLGRENAFTEGAPTAGEPRTIEFAAYAQDDWKLSKRLTLNIGLRWDPWLPFSDNLNRIAQFRPGEQSIVYPTAPVGYVFPGDPGVSSTTMHSRLNNWGPRIGFAYDLFGNGRTSLRGGYGIFYSDIREQGPNNIPSDEPFGISLAVSQPTGGMANPYADTGNPFPFTPPTTAQQRAAFQFSVPATTLSEWDPSFRDAIVQQWNFSVQQQLFSDWIITVAYVGSNGNHLFLTNQLNPTVYGKVAANTNLERVYAPYYSSIVDIISIGQSNYNALQLSANKRFHHGITVLLNYTFSKSIDEGSNDSSTPADPYNIRMDRAVSDFNLPNKFVGSFVWDLPGASIHNRALRALTGGWELNGIITLQSGLPVNVLSGVNNSGTAVGDDRANVIANPNLPGGRSTAQMLREYFNTAAFTVNTAGTFGSVGRNTLIGPNMENVDAGLMRNFAIHERYKIQFRAESFNLFNHPSFNNPNATVSSSTFGTITSAGSPRVMQLALKAMF